MVSVLQVMCQHINFLSVTVMTWVITSIRSRYQIVHACNVMFAAVNFLPGQVWHLITPKLILPVYLPVETVYQHPGMKAHTQQ